MRSPVRSFSIAIRPKVLDVPLRAVSGTGVSRPDTAGG